MKKQTKKKRKSPKSYTRQELIEKYQEVREEYGDKAKSSRWMQRNGFMWLCNWVHKQGTSEFGSWHNFKVASGFDDPKGHCSKQELIDKYKAIRKEYGDKASISGWMRRNGFGWISAQARKAFGSWHKFKVAAGFNDHEIRLRSEQELINEYKAIRGKYGNKAKSSAWMRRNGFGWLCSQQVRSKFDSWHKFKVASGFNDPKSHCSMQELIDQYKKARKKYGDKASGCGWMKNNGFSWLYRQGRHGCGSWHKFKVESGFNDEKRKSPKPYTRQELIDKYREIREEYGDEASSCGWMIENGFGWLHRQVHGKFGSWVAFKRIAGEFCEPFTKEEVEI